MTCKHQWSKRQEFLVCVLCGARRRRGPADEQMLKSQQNKGKPRVKKGGG